MFAVVVGGEPLRWTEMTFARDRPSLFRSRLPLTGFCKQRSKCVAELRQIDAILRTLRAGDARLHIAEIEFEIDAVIDLALARHAEHFLRAEIIFERGALLVGAAGRAQIIHGLLIDREKAHRRAILRRHVADRRAIRQRQRSRACAVKFDELADHFLRAQHLRDVQREIGRGHAFAQRAGQMHADDFRREKINRLTEHARFRFDAADAPADDAEAVDHRRVRIGADERVRDNKFRSPLFVRARLWRDIRDSPGARCRCPAARARRS